MRKYKHLTAIVFSLIKNKSLMNHIMSYMIGKEPCEYLKNIVHYHILKELQLFNVSRYNVYNRHYIEDIFDKNLMFQIHAYIYIYIYI